MKIMKRCMKKKRFYAPVDRLVRGAVLLLVVVSLLGLFRLYANAQQAADSLTISERGALSSKINLETCDYDNNVIEKSRSLYGTLVTSDGKVLLNLTERNTNTPSLGGLLGTLEKIDMADTRYFLNNNKDSLFPDVSWNAINGFSSPVGTVTLTIDSRIQESIYQKMVDLGIYGSVVLYNFRTGELKAVCSTPGFAKKDAAGVDIPGAFLNKALYKTSPGSTQKVLTLFLAESQGIDTANLRFTCSGTYLLSDGNSVVCTGIHGDIDGVTAIGKSCNCWFAQLVERLSVQQAAEQLVEMGWIVNGQDDTFQVGNIPVDKSSLVWENYTFNSVWSLIGQCEAMASPLQMVELAGNYATAGQAIRPRLTTAEPIVKTTYGDKYASAFERAWTVWQSGFKQHYPERDYGGVTAAKTGTSDKLGSGETHKLLLAIIDDYALYIVVENYLESHVMPFELLPSIEKAISQL